MEFLYKLYDMEYFAVGLLIVIAILVFLFLLILFFGKKDEKKAKLEKTLELQTGFKENEEVKEELTVPEIPQPVLEQVEISEEKEIEVPIFETPFVQESEVDDVKPQMPIIEEEIEDNIFTDNIVSEIEESVAAIDIDNLFQTNSEIASEPKEETEDIIEENIEEDTTIEEPKLETPKVEAPFSSVFTNNEVVSNTVEPKKETKVFELPKMVEMPKLKEEIKEENVSDFDSLFENIEPETYNINK